MRAAIAGRVDHHGVDKRVADQLVGAVVLLCALLSGTLVVKVASHSEAASASAASSIEWVDQSCLSLHLASVGFVRFRGALSKLTEAGANLQLEAVLLRAPARITSESLMAWLANIRHSREDLTTLVVYRLIN